MRSADVHEFVEPGIVRVVAHVRAGVAPVNAWVHVHGPRVCGLHRRTYPAACDIILGFAENGTWLWEFMSASHACLSSYMPCGWQNSTWQDGTNELACKDLTPCPSGSFINALVTTSTDRPCAACGSSTFTSTPNEFTCAAWQDCVAGNYESQKPSASVNRGCTSCALVRGRPEGGGPGGYGDLADESSYRSLVSLPPPPLHHISHNSRRSMILEQNRLCFPVLAGYLTSKSSLTRHHHPCVTVMVTLVSPLLL